MTLLHALTNVAKQIELAWDSDLDSKTGKLLCALAGRLPGYSPDIDRLRRMVAEQGPQPISTAPRDGTYILLGGDSGYIGTPLRWEVGHWDPVYRPLTPWVVYDGRCFTEGGGEPTLWAPLPK